MANFDTCRNHEHDVLYDGRFEGCPLCDACARLETAEEALRLSVLFTDPNYTARYDGLAERFYEETGIMAPGKSVALEMATSQPPDDARATAYREWLGKLVERVHEMARAALSETKEPG